MSKVVFVGNVPYQMGEEQLIDTFKTVGQVIGFRLVYDRETGKPKGYGFCEFAVISNEKRLIVSMSERVHSSVVLPSPLSSKHCADHETAMSAVRNLNNTDCGGRPLRIDLADSDPYLEGKTTVHGEIIDAGETRAQWRQREKRDGFDDRQYPPSREPGNFLKLLSQGVPLPPGTTALDAISHRLASIDPAQLTEVLAQMKAFVINHPEQARMLLVAHPQLSYALFQALLLNRVVDPAILQRMLAATQATSNTGASPPRPSPQTAPAPQMPPMPSQYPPFPPQMQPTMQPPVPSVQHPPYYHQPTPPHPPVLPVQSAPPQLPVPPPVAAPTPTAAPSAPVAVPPPATAPPQINLPDNIDPTQRAMLQHVLSLPADQIPNLPPNEREAIMLLRAQFLGPNANQKS